MRTFDIFNVRLSAVMDGLTTMIIMILMMDKITINHGIYIFNSCYCDEYIYDEYDSDVINFRIKRKYRYR